MPSRNSGTRSNFDEENVGDITDAHPTHEVQFTTRDVDPTIDNLHTTRTEPPRYGVLDDVAAGARRRTTTCAQVLSL